MPQGRRKVPFSGKQKKQQLLAKKQAKCSTSHNLIRNLKDEESSDISEDSDMPRTFGENIEKINMQPLKDPRSKTNRYVLQFHRETPKELRELKEEARKGLEYRSEKEMELGDNYFQRYDFPTRPKWCYEMSKEQLDGNENRYFFKYVTKLEKDHYDDMKSLSFCELNLETWRQLWRVLELSDIVLIIVDARFPTLMFPPSLYKYVTEELGKGMMLVINKIDLVEAEAVLAWKQYFERKYPEIKVVLFTSYPSYNLRGKQESKYGLKIRRRRGRMRMAAEGAQQIYDVCRKYVGDEVDLASWEQKILEERNTPMDVDGDDGDEKLISERTHEEEKDFAFEEHVKFRNGVLTIGCVGFPNVGKSSLLNAVMGRKVVSVSRTPGHTKHFQTIFLTNTVRLCDCPGLVFPSSTPRRLQVLMGSYPIAQLREPYGSIRFLAERIDLVQLLALKHPEGDDEEWSPIDICDAWAVKRGFLTAKAARPDTYRAANSILRMALDGKITLSLKPIGYHQERAQLATDPGLARVKEIQALVENDGNDDEDDCFSDTDTEDVAGVSNDGDNEDDEDANSTLSPPACSSSANPFDLLGSPE